MSRLELLRFKSAASSYGQPLTFVEQLELERLEEELNDARQGRRDPGGVAECRGATRVETLICEA